MNKILIVMIALAITAPVMAADNYMIQDGSTYKILNEITSSYISGGLVKYIVAENQTEINNLEFMERELNFSASKAIYESVRLDRENNSTARTIESSKIMLSKTETNRNETRQLLAAVEGKKTRLENTLNSSVLLNPGSYNIGTAIFIILIIIAVTMKSRSILLKNSIDIKKNVEKGKASKNG